MGSEDTATEALSMSSEVTPSMSRPMLTSAAENWEEFSTGARHVSMEELTDVHGCTK